MHIDSEIKVSPPYHCQFSEDRVSDQFSSNGFMCTLFFFFDCDRRSYVFIVHYKYIYIYCTIFLLPLEGPYWSIKSSIKLNIKFLRMWKYCITLSHNTLWNVTWDILPLGNKLLQHDWLQNKSPPMTPNPDSEGFCCSHSWYKTALHHTSSSCRGKSKCAIVLYRI